MEAILVFITAGSREEAERIADVLLAARLAACVNTVPDVRSEYWWRGSRDCATEVLILAKTRRDLWAPLLAEVRRSHSYQVFEAIAVPIVESNPDYLQWILENTAPATP